MCSDAGSDQHLGAHGDRGAAVNTKAKGTRAEHRAMRILEAAGYVCTRAGASLGLFDVIAIGPSDVRLLQVKAGTKYLSGEEREQIVALAVPANVSRECWRFPDRCRTPLIERL
jgi:hypothetical protein